jgi:hypothetical protein
MLQNGQTESEGVQMYVDERGIFAVKCLTKRAKIQAIQRA